MAQRMIESNDPDEKAELKDVMAQGFCGPLAQNQSRQGETLSSRN